jgi:hypothetical protein
MYIYIYIYIYICMYVCIYISKLLIRIFEILSPKRVRRSSRAKSGRALFGLEISSHKRAGRASRSEFDLKRAELLFE